MSLLERFRFNLVESVEDVTEFMQWLGERRDWLAVDVETTGLNAGCDKVRLVQFGDTERGWAMEYRNWRGVVKQAIESYRGRMVAHNLLYDSKMLMADGIDIPQHLAHDTMVMAHLKNPAVGMDLKGSAARYVDRDARAGQNLLKEAFKNGGWTWATIPVEVPAYWVYSTLDTCLTAHLAEKLYPEISSSYNAPYELELGVIHCLRKAELAGMLVDEEYRQRAEEKLRYELAVLTPQIPINANSDQQVVAYLHSLGARWEVYTDEGNLSVSKDVLRWLAPNFPECTIIEQIRSKSRMLGNYIEKIANIEDGGLAVDGVLRANTRPVAARTGRMSITEPPLQTLPRGRLVRDAFIARDGTRYVMADFSGMEMRALASFAQEHRMLDMFNGGLDVHTETAKSLYGENFTKQQRTICKNGGFSKIYGAGLEKFAATAQIPIDQALSFLTSYDEMFPRVKGFMEEVARDVVMRAGGKRSGYGWVELIDGRRLLVEADKAYKGVNFTIQGSCAISMKQKICELDAAGLGDFFRLPVHDELLFEVPDEDVQHALTTIGDIMPDRTNFPGVTLEIESDVVQRWGQHYRGDFPAYIETEDPQWLTA